MIDLQKKIFITGATWFIGSNLLRRLIKLWAKDIHILLRKESNSSRIQDAIDWVQVHTFSLEDRDETLENITRIQPQIIFHLAAAGTAVWRTPFTIEELIHMNTLWMMNLVDAAIVAQCECFVNTGSSSEYGKKDHPMSEWDIIEPNNPYGLSKAVSTQYATYIGKAKNFPIVTFRLFSVYGPYEEPSRLIPTLINNYLSWVASQLSSPHSVRDFIYIDDVIDAFLEADKAIWSPGEIFNIGTGIQYSIQDVVNTIKKLLNSEINPIFGQQRMNQVEPTSWVANNNKMKTILNIELKDIKIWLSKTIEYYTQVKNL